MLCTFAKGLGKSRGSSYLGGHPLLLWDFAICGMLSGTRSIVSLSGLWVLWAEVAALGEGAAPARS